MSLPTLFPPFWGWAAQPDPEGTLLRPRLPGAVRRREVVHGPIFGAGNPQSKPTAPKHRGEVGEVRSGDMGQWQYGGEFSGWQNQDEGFV